MRKRVSRDMFMCVRIIEEYQERVSCHGGNFSRLLGDIGYNGPLVIESFDPGFEELNRQCAIWRKLAESRRRIGRKGTQNLKAIAQEIEGK